ncbi:MAG: hypothetical protein ACTTJW_00005 [Sphaerochaeta sp.]
MKKALFVVLSVFVLLALVSCKNPELPTTGIGTPNLSNIEFAKYDAFAVMRESNGARGLSDSINGEINRLFGLTEDTFEKIPITDDKGLEWACNEVSNLGKDFLLIGLSCTHSAGPTVYKNYIVDRPHNKVIDLSFLNENELIKPKLKDLNILTTAEGLFAKKDSMAVRIDPETKTMTPLTNPKTDAVMGFYRDSSGNMLVKTDKCKLFPADGSSPIDYTDDSNFEFLIRAGVCSKDPMIMLVNPDYDMIVCLAKGEIYHMSSGKLEKETIPWSKRPHFGYEWSRCCLYPKTHTEFSQNVICYLYKEGYVSIHDISTGELLFTKYDAPKYLGYENVAYWDGYFIYSTESSLYSLNLEAQTTETVVEGSLAKWQMTTGGVIYTKYLSATENETCFYNLATKETEKLSSSGVEVVSIASFVE